MTAYGKRLITTLVLAGLLLIAAGASASDVTVGEATSADGLTIMYDVRGEGSPALVFVHCWCCNRGFWKNQVDEFSKDHKVVTVDLGGHGESSMGRETWTMEAFGNDVVAVVDKLKLEKVILIGHSMGGPVVLEAAAKLGDKVIGIVGVDNFQNFQMKYQTNQIEGFLAAFKRSFAKTTAGFVGTLFPADADSALKADIASQMASAPPEVGVSAMDELLHHDPLPLLKVITAPIRGINSERVPVQKGLNQQVAHDYDLIVMSGVGHFPHLEKPKEFNENLRKIINEMAPKK